LDESENYVIDEFVGVGFNLVFYGQIQFFIQCFQEVLVGVKLDLDQGNVRIMGFYYLYFSPLILFIAIIFIILTFNATRLFSTLQISSNLKEKPDKEISKPFENCIIDITGFW